MGFGCRDFRGKSVEHFEVNRHYIVVAASQNTGRRRRSVARFSGASNRKVYGIQADKINPTVTHNENDGEHKHGIGGCKGSLI